MKKQIKKLNEFEKEYIVFTDKEKNTNDEYFKTRSSYIICWFGIKSAEKLYVYFMNEDELCDFIGKHGIKSIRHVSLNDSIKVTGVIEMN